MYLIEQKKKYSRIFFLMLLDFRNKKIRLALILTGHKPYLWSGEDRLGDSFKYLGF